MPPEIPPAVVERVAQKAVASVPIIAGDEGPRPPQYLTECERFAALSPQYVAAAGVAPPVATAVELEAVRQYQAAVESVAAWRRDADQTRGSIRPGLGEPLWWLGAVTGLRRQFAEVRAAIEASNAATEAADTYAAGLVSPAGFFGRAARRSAP